MTYPKICDKLGGFRGIKELFLDFFNRVKFDKVLKTIYQIDENHKPEDKIEYLAKKYTYFLVN